MLNEGIVSMQVREFIISNFLYGQDRALGDADSFLNEGIVDSTGVLQLVTFLEETYGIAVADEELIPENLDSIRSVVAYLSRKTDGLFDAGAPSEAAMGENV
ncbi:MAG TPA: acyl carrier protein [Silvibacterium sp.]|nr:acyl carrier protein [Silvibacterium sp.]